MMVLVPETLIKVIKEYFNTQVMGPVKPMYDSLDKCPVVNKDQYLIMANALSAHMKAIEAKANGAVPMPDQVETIEAEAPAP